MTFFQRVKRVWFLLRHKDAFTRFDHWDRTASLLERLIASPAYAHIENAVVKTKQDPSWHPTKDHEPKREETQEWARTYCREAGVQAPSAWELNFLIEWIIGRKKGRL